MEKEHERESKDKFGCHIDFKVSGPVSVDFITV